MENIFKIIAGDVDQSLPSGEQWHKKLLRQMTIGTPLRPPLHEKEFGNELSDYLKFRHLKCNIYGFMLDWEKMEPLVEKLPQTIKKEVFYPHLFRVVGRNGERKISIDQLLRLPENFGAGCFQAGQQKGGEVELVPPAQNGERKPF